MADTEAQKRAHKKYYAEHFEYIKLRLNKGDKERLKELANAENKSVNQYILDKIFDSNKAE